MATVRTTMTDVKKQKLSFAKVLASAPTDKPNPSTARDAGANTGRENQTQSSSTGSPVIADGAPENVEPSNAAATEPSGQDQVADGLRNLKLDSNPTPSLVVNGASSTSTQQSSKAQTPSESASQKADSSSELGTKPASIDGKSITSGTTFNALDEKESLRPDDSASVMAAEQDDDIFSIRGSLIAGSRMGSEVAARFHRIQLGDMPPRSVATQHVIVESGPQGVVAPQSTALEQQPVTDAKIALVGTTPAPNGMYGQHPDEKLLEAMQSQKDRIFLLKLEEMVIEFVQDSKEPFMDLPPSNSFCRMLTHKLADYYHMTHSFEAGAGGVRIFRTPFCRVPPSLASIAHSASAASTPPPMVMPKKIMRRGEGGEFGGGFGRSKRDSDDGSDAKDKANGKEKMSREEREEAYNKARERIFGTANTDTSTPDNDESTGISRASSVSTRDKSNGGKKARRRRDSDNFDTRSNYVAYAPAYGHPQQATWVQPHYMPANAQFSGPVQQPYPTQMPNMYGPPSQQFPPMLPGNSYGPQYNSMTNYSQPSGPPRYQPPVNPMPPAAYVPPMQGPPPSQHGWQQQPTPPAPSFNQSPYQSRATPAGTPGIPYAYGALPANANPNDPKSQHPIPGSFNRHAFNPKTQSFVPGNGMPPMPPPPGPYNSYGPPQQGSPQIAPPHLAYAGYQVGPPPMGQPPYGNASGYNMMRQGSNNSLPPYHPPPPTAQHPVHVPHQLPPHPPPQGPPHIPNKPTMPQGPAMPHGPPYSNLPNYGNPAALPQKPTT